MLKYNVSTHISFYVIGISYQKADAKTRGKFNLNIDQRKALLHKAKSLGLDSVVTSSTCNRTEIYAFANQEETLIDLLCEFSLGDQETFSENGYVLKNELAIDHMFKVGSGLDSQILGDFEIISQMKSAFILSKNKA